MKLQPQLSLFNNHGASTSDLDRETWRAGGESPAEALICSDALAALWSIPTPRPNLQLDFYTGHVDVNSEALYCQTSRAGSRWQELPQGGTIVTVGNRHRDRWWLWMSFADLLEKRVVAADRTFTAVLWIL